MCGVIGIHGSPLSAQEAYQGLLLLQHRGQDGAGILSQNQNQIHLHKDIGLVDQVFNKEILERLEGFTSIGHTRYSTIGKIKKSDSLPFLTNYPFGISLAHNGNIINSQQLKCELLNTNRRFTQSNNDAEVLLNLIASTLSNQNTFSFESLIHSANTLMNKAQGAYSIIGSILGHGMFAMRDPSGIRPLVYGKKFDGTNWVYAFASESNPLDYLGFKDITDVEPGELIFIDNDYNLMSKIIKKENQKTCMFEWIYFANPESIIDSKMVYHTRLKLGENLGQKIKKFLTNKEIDVVVPVPETSRTAAISISEVIQRPYRELLVKNRYIQRSFILNDQKSRENAVRLKLSPIKSEIKNKNILLVDDSIVRGTTSTKIIKLMRDAGARRIYIASTCPPILNSCNFGIDFPTTKELIAYDKNYSEIKESIGADEIIYLDIPMLIESLETDQLCMKCLNSKDQAQLSDIQMTNQKQHKIREYYENDLPRYN